jgi:hypothetical protein
MGVLACSRIDCTEIMCDTYINDIGYICNYCKDEFKHYFDSNGVVAATEGNIIEELRKFMSIRKTSNDYDNKITVDEFFNKNTRG